MIRRVFGRDNAGLWSLPDQGAVSLGNFLTNIFLARTLSISDYGIFALIYSFLVFLNSFHACAILYPLTVRGAESDTTGLHKYTRRSLVLTASLFVPFAIGIFGATEILGRPKVGLWAILALLCWQTQETLRRSLMAHLRHGEAIWGDAISYLGQAAIIYFCLKRGYMDLEIVFGIIAATSIIAAALQASQLRFQIRGKSEILKYAQDSWNLSRWALLANLAVGLPGIAFPWFLALGGTKEAASFQVLVNLAAVANPVLLSMSNVLVPATARAGREGGWHAARRITTRYAIWGALLLLPFYLVGISWPRAVLRIFYGSGSPYLNEELSLRLLIIGFSIAYGASVVAALFYGLGESKSVLKAQFGGAVAAVILGFPLIVRYGVSGAASALILVYITQFVLFSSLISGIRSKDMHLPQGGNVAPVERTAIRDAASST